MDMMRNHLAALVSVLVVISACEAPRPSPEPVEPKLRQRPAETVQSSTPTEESGDAGVEPHAMRVAFEKESRESAWASSLEGLITSTVSEFPDSQLVSVECRTTVCKVVVSHSTSAVGAKWDRAFTYKVLNSGPDKNKPYRGAFTYEATLDMRTTTTYMTRNGYGEPHSDGTPRKKRPLPPGWPAETR